MPNDKPEEWFATNEMARVFGVTKRGFTSVVKPIVPPECIQSHGRGKETLWHCRGVIDAWVAHKLKLSAKPEDEDPEMSGESSPALERFRELRCKGLELDLAEREGKLVPIDEFKQWLGPIVSAFRGVLERIKTTAPDVHEMLNEVIQRFREEVDAGDS